MSQPYTLEQGNTIVISLSSPALQAKVEQLKPDLMTFLRQQLLCPTLSLETQIVKESVERKLYTDQDKFNHLAEKYPMLRELQQRLGLDVDL